MKEKDKFGKHYHFNNWYGMPVQYGLIDLIQVGELSCEAGYEVDGHLQQFIEISFITKGTGSFYINEQEFAVNEGEIFINLPGEVHRIRANSNSKLHFYFLAFSFNQSTEPELEPTSSFFNKAIEPRKAVDKYDMDRVWDMLLKEFYAESPMTHALIQTYLYQILILTYRSFLLYKPVNKLKKNENVVGGTVYSVIKYIDDNIYNLKNIRVISQDLSYSYTYISHLFKNKMRITLQNYVNFKRIEKSIELLNDETLSISNIANKLGYESLHAYTKAFKKTIGMAPTLYRKKCLVKQDNTLGGENSGNQDVGNQDK